MAETLSVIIPSLNEVEALPGLLKALNEQTRRPDEIIVADAGSTDGTAEAAQRLGAQVVPGGMPGPGRNAGARASSGSRLLFLDADVLPHPDFIAGALNEFEEHGYVAAGCLIEPLADDTEDKTLADIANLFILIVQYFQPHANGFCILARRDVHEAIGGFDEQIKIAEDHDYVQRAARHGDFGVLTSVRIPVSMRRVETEGLTRLAIKYLWCEMYALAGKPIYSTPFEYEFGTHGQGGPRRLIDIGALREQLGSLENPLHHLSETGREALHALTESDWVAGAADSLRLALDRGDYDIIRDYLKQRFDLMNRSRRPQRETLAKLQDRTNVESIRLLNSQQQREREAQAPETAESD